MRKGIIERQVAVRIRNKCSKISAVYIVVAFELQRLKFLVITLEWLLTGN